jgi:hypothetical protein
VVANFFNFIIDTAHHWGCKSLSEWYAIPRVERLVICGHKRAADMIAHLRHWELEQKRKESEAKRGKRGR